MNVSNLVHGNPGGRSCSLLSLVLEHSLLLHFQQTWLYSLISSPILSTLKVKNVFCKIAAVSDESSLKVSTVIRKFKTFWSIRDKSKEKNNTLG